MYMASSLIGPKETYNCLEEQEHGSNPIKQVAKAVDGVALTAMQKSDRDLGHAAVLFRPVCCPENSEDFLMYVGCSTTAAAN